jgi:hypothetical protein
MVIQKNEMKFLLLTLTSLARRCQKFLPTNKSENLKLHQTGKYLRFIAYPVLKVFFAMWNKK